MKNRVEPISRALFLASLCLVLLLIPGRPVSAQSTGRLPRPWEGEPAWLNFELGKRHYQAKEFGEALIAFDRAIAERRNAFRDAKIQFEIAMDSAHARKAGNSINTLLASFASEDFLAKEYKSFVDSANGSQKRLFTALKEERISEAHRAFLTALLAVMTYHPIDNMDDSLRRLDSEIEILSTFPEAEFWKAKVFMVEGELKLAEQQFLRAFDYRASLEVPEERYEILYALAELYNIEGDMSAWENVMKRILSDDPVAGDPALDPFQRDAMLSTIRKDGIERFMTLYRLEPGFSFSANMQIAEFYVERGRAQSLLHAAVTVNMLITRAIAMLREYDRHFVWTDIQSFINMAGRYRAVIDYLEEKGFYAQLLILGDALYLSDSRQHANYIWRFIADNGKRPDSATATIRLQNPVSAIRSRMP